jgi:DNA-directed RNA polymerase II subunit RPB7
MFFLKQLVHSIQLHPIYFGRNIKNELVKRLYSEVEGTCNGQVGYIITVLEVIDISAGRLLPSSGLAEFKINYKAIVFRPFKNQIVDGVVSTVNKVHYYYIIYC